MALTIVSNAAADVAHRYVADGMTRAAASVSKLSSGSRVDAARDDAASLAIGSRLRAETAALRQAQVNAGQAVSMLQIAEGAASVIQNQLVRLKTLAVQAASGQLSQTERAMLNVEFQALLSDIDRIALDTTFNNSGLIDHSGIIYTVRSETGEGTLFRGNVALARGDRFTQSDLDNGTVRYVHAGGVTLTDRVIVSVSDADGNALGGVTNEGSRAAFETAEYFASSGLAFINASTAYGRAASYGVNGGGDGVRIAIIDTGVDADHTDLDDNIVGGFDFGDTDANFDDDSPAADHGTHVAGIAAAERNGAGTMGVAYDADILAIKVADATGAFTDQEVADAINFAVANGANVINLSLAVSVSGALAAALTNAINNGVIVVAAAGNFRGNPDPALDALSGNPLPPAIVAADPGAQGMVIAVGATDATNTLAGFSHFAGIAQNFFVVAPGVDINATTNDGATGLKSGTSMAAPHVAGAAAVLMELFPQLNAQEIADLIRTSATDLGVSGIDTEYGRGLIDLAKASNPLATISFSVSQGGTAVVGAASVDADALYDNPFARIFTSVDFKVGTGTGSQDRLNVRLGALTVASLALRNEGVGSVGAANQAITAVDAAIDRLADIRATIGSSQSRLDFAASNLDTAVINTEAARSALLDLDVAREMSAFVAKQIVVRGGVSMLSQASELQRLMLRLLQI